MSAILVVDDEDYLRDLIKEILEMHGHDAVVIGSAQAALQLCRRRPFDLVITDVAMPGMDGLVIRALRRSTRPTCPGNFRQFERSVPTCRSAARRCGDSQQALSVGRAFGCRRQEPSETACPGCDSVRP
jgi:CheY-like chemotaxis protein